MPRYTTIGGYPNTDPYYISPEEEAEMAIKDWTGACGYCPANFRTQAELEEHERSHAAPPPDVLVIARNMVQSPDNWPPMRVKQVAEALLAMHRKASDAARDGAVAAQAARSEPMNPHRAISARRGELS